MPNTSDANRLAAAGLDPVRSIDEILAAKADGLTLVQWREKQAGAAGSVALDPDDGDVDRLEKAEQLEVRKVFRAFGGIVHSLSQARASKQAAGLGDLFVVFEGLASFWWETKRQIGGRVSDAQQEFHERCNGVPNGSRHYIGGRKEAEDLVIALGLAYSDDGVLEPVRKP
jgi:hypothetical protein